MSSIYQVGKQQLTDWIVSNSVTAMDGSNIARVQLGGYVLVHTVAHYGRIETGVHVTRFFKCSDIAMEYIRVCQECYSGSDSLRVFYELWEIVDDGDLWQVWDHDSAKACKDGGQPTDYHVYDGRVCVLDLVCEVPSMLYAVTVVDDADQVVSSDWYSDVDKWADAVNLATESLDGMLSLEHQTAGELGVYVVDDWDRDEGLADGISVLNAYYRFYRSE